MQNIIRVMGASDLQIFIFFNNRLHCKLLDRFLPLYTQLGGATFTVLTSLCLMLFGKGELRLIAAKGSISLAISFLIGFVLKEVLGRPRPYLVIPSTNISDIVWKDYSFPSGHTTAGFSLAINYAAGYPEIAVGLVSSAILIGLSRIYLGHHYPTDVLAGAVLGSLTAITVNLI